MAVPKRKISKTRKRSRRAGHKFSLPRTVPCPHCHQPRQPHRICPYCGYYKGKLVIQAEKS
ncbi:MAG: 50S ribosomal protein L32 [Candidatus Euphemobacter frigidus]|nr:50S ribosomal protein L32 [Candidatus Euphemobacter frigidus]MDP8275108.1 50S ribosomal protein L32 [Candidatus Euphemobacter frigidus]